MKCGECNFCEKKDGSPYCVCKDLYTHVKLDDDCDEYDYWGNFMYSEITELLD